MSHRPDSSTPAAPAPAESSLRVTPGSGAVSGGVRTLLQFEGLAALAVATTLYAGTGMGWGMYALLFLAPDLSFVAFAAGPRIGAIAYNALHTHVAPLGLLLLAMAMRMPHLLPFAYIWAAHIGFDRLMGYGLKYPTDFNDTHLGRKGRVRPSAGAEA